MRINDGGSGGNDRCQVFWFVLNRIGQGLIVYEYRYGIPLSLLKKRHLHFDGDVPVPATVGWEFLLWSTWEVCGRRRAQTRVMGA